MASGWRMVPGGVVCGATGLLLGAVFSHWQADYDVLWSSVSASNAAHRAAEEYFLELVAEPGSLRAINIGVLSIVAAALVALVIKLGRNDTSALLFDGASMLLYGAALSVYGTTVRSNFDALASKPTPSGMRMEEILRDLASAHAVIAVALTGIITLQGVQAWVDKAQPEQDPVVSTGALPPSTAPAAAASAIQDVIEQGEDGEADTETERATSPAPTASGSEKRTPARRRKKGGKS